MGLSRRSQLSDFLYPLTFSFLSFDLQPYCHTPACPTSETRTCWTSARLGPRPCLLFFGFMVYGKKSPQLILFPLCPCTPISPAPLSPIIACIIFHCIFKHSVSTFQTTALGSLGTDFFTLPEVIAVEWIWTPYV